MAEPNNNQFLSGQEFLNTLPQNNTGFNFNLPSTLSAENLADIRAGITSVPNPALSPSSGFNFSLPSTLSGIDLSKALETPFTAEDTRKLIADQQANNLRIAELLKPSVREQELQKSIGQLESGLMADIQMLNSRPGMDFFTFGRGVSQATRDTNIRLDPLQRSLALEQGNRKDELEGRKFLSQQTNQQIQQAQQANDRAFQRFQFIAQQAQQLQDNARQALSTILTNFGGLAFEDLDPQTQDKVKQLAANSGLPEGLLRSGMATIKERNIAANLQKQADLQAQRDIQNQIALARLEIAANKAGVKDAGDIEYLNLYTGDVDKYLQRGSTPKEAVQLVAAMANKLGSKLSQDQQTALLNYAAAKTQLELQKQQTEAAAQAPAPTPIEQKIAQLRSGNVSLSDADIRSALRTQGFSTTEIDNSSAGSLFNKAGNAVSSFFGNLFKF